MFVCNFGRDQVNAIKQATDFGLKETTKIVAPALLLTARIAGGTEVFDQVIGGTSYYWRLEETIPSAKALNDKFRAAYQGAVPSDYGALGYAGVRTILEAAKIARGTDSDKVIDALQALKYDYYKGLQYYRACDHQSVQSVIIIESKSKDNINANDVFNILAIVPADEKKLRSCAELGQKA